MNSTGRLLVSFLLFAPMAMPSTASELPANETDEGVITLFDGKTLDGWTTQSGQPVTKGWKVEDGALVRTGGGGAIYAAGEFGDFVLEFRWKIAARGNSGLKYRVRYYEKGVRGNPGWLGLEYQLWDDVGRQSDPTSKSSAGELYALFGPSENKRLHPAGEYNDSRIVVRAARIEHWLNGELIVEVDTSSPQWRQRIDASKFKPVEGFGENARGRIQLQDHGSQVWFRDITLRPLDLTNELGTGQDPISLPPP